MTALISQYKRVCKKMFCQHRYFLFKKSVNLIASVTILCSRGEMQNWESFVLYSGTCLVHCKTSTKNMNRPKKKNVYSQNNFFSNQKFYETFFFIFKFLRLVKLFVAKTSKKIDNENGNHLSLLMSLVKKATPTPLCLFKV